MTDGGRKLTHHRETARRLCQLKYC